MSNIFSTNIQIIINCIIFHKVEFFHLLHKESRHGDTFLSLSLLVIDPCDWLSMHLNCLREAHDIPLIKYLPR